MSTSVITLYYFAWDKFVQKKKRRSDADLHEGTFTGKAVGVKEALLPNKSRTSEIKIWRCIFQAQFEQWILCFISSHRLTFTDMLSVKTNGIHTLTNLSNNVVTTCHTWSYYANDCNELLTLLVDGVLVPLPSTISNQLQQALLFPKTQPHPNFCCIDFVHWLRGVYTSSFINRCDYTQYTLHQLNSTSRLIGNVGDTYLLQGQLSSDHEVEPLHAFMQLGTDLFVWKPGNIGFVCFSNFNQLMDQYRLYSNLSISQMKWKNEECRQ